MSAQIATFTVSFSASVSSKVCTKPSGTVDGDRLVAIHYMDADSANSGMTAPAGWTQVGSTQNIALDGNCKVWTKIASSEGASYTFGTGSGSDNTIYLLRITGAGAITVGPTFAGSATQTVTHVASSITPTNADSLLIFAWFCLNEGNAGTSWGASPAGLTNLNLVDQASASPWIRTRVAYQEAQPASASGTKTITHSNARRWLALSLVVAASSTPIAASDAETFTDTASVSPVTTETVAFSDPTPALSNTLSATDAVAFTETSSSVSPLVSDTQTLSEISSVSITLDASDTQTLTEVSSVNAPTVASDSQTLSETSTVALTLNASDAQSQTETGPQVVGIPVADTHTQTEVTATVLDTSLFSASDTHTLSGEVSSVFITTIKTASDTQTLTEGTTVPFVTADRADTQTLVDLTPSYTNTLSRTDTQTLGEAFALLVALNRVDSQHILNFASINFPPIPRRIYGTAEVPEIAQEITVVDYFGNALVVIAYGGTVETVHNISGSVLED